jgi:putative endonuclease
MYYVYALYSIKTKTIYIGSTENLKQRISDHNSGLGGYFSKRSKPFKLLFYEAYVSKKDALKQEKFYKTGYGREILKDKTKDSLKKMIVTI